MNTLKYSLCSRPIHIKHRVVAFSSDYIAVPLGDSMITTDYDDNYDRNSVILHWPEPFDVRNKQTKILCMMKFEITHKQCLIDIFSRNYIANCYGFPEDVSGASIIRFHGREGDDTPMYRDGGWRIFFSQPETDSDKKANVGKSHRIDLLGVFGHFKLAQARHTSRGMSSFVLKARDPSIGISYIEDYGQQQISWCFETPSEWDIDEETDA